MSDSARSYVDTPQTIPIDQWMKYWKTARENTSRGPSPMHFGVLKAGAHSKMLASIDCWMTEIPRRSGYSPVRWRSAIAAILWKKPGVFVVESTRTIVLFEPDFNYLNKYNGRLAMANAELFGQLAKEQYGSRKAHRSIDQGTNKRLTTDMFLLRREPGALCSNDAKGCYDRIHLGVAALALFRQRLDESGIVRCLRRSKLLIIMLERSTATPMKPMEVRLLIDLLYKEVTKVTVPALQFGLSLALGYWIRFVLQVLVPPLSWPSLGA